MRSSYKVTLSVSLALLVCALSSNAQTQANPPKWRASRVTLSVSDSLGSAANIQGSVREALEGSIAVWQAAGDLRIVVVPSDAQDISQKGGRGDGLSLLTAAPTAENVKLFPKQADSPAAVTRVFSDSRRNITEADIALNPFVKFSTDGTYGTFDLQDTLTHEIGHVLGLRHSPIWSSIMYEKGSTSLGPGSYRGSVGILPDVDAAGVRSLYGAPADDFACCGFVSGRISGLPPASRDSETLVWLEDPESGRLFAAAEPARDGSYRVDGLREGSYRLFVRSVDSSGRIAVAEQSLSVQIAEVTKANFSLSHSERPFRVDLLGTTMQLARQAARITTGGSHRIHLAGYGDPSGISRIFLTANKENFAVRGMISDSSFESVKVIDFALPLPDPTVPGQYTLAIEFADGTKDYLVGAVNSAGHNASSTSLF